MIIVEFVGLAVIVSFVVYCVMWVFDKIVKSGDK